MKAAGPADGEALRLPPLLGLRAASGLKDDLLARRGAPLSLDASDVQQIGALCLQVLVSAKETWRADGLPLGLVASSPEFDRGLALLGADPALISTATEHLS